MKIIKKGQVQKKLNQEEIQNKIIIKKEIYYKNFKKLQIHKIKKIKV